MEPVEKVLNIELFLGKTGMTTNIGGKMELEVQRQVTKCVWNNADVFAFKSTDLKGIDPKIALHQLHEDPSVKTVKQKLRRSDECA